MLNQNGRQTILQHQRVETTICTIQVCFGQRLGCSVLFWPTTFMLRTWDKVPKYFAGLLFLKECENCKLKSLFFLETSQLVTHCLTCPKSGTKSGTKDQNRIKLNQNPIFSDWFDGKPRKRRSWTKLMITFARIWRIWWCYDSVSSQNTLEPIGETCPTRSSSCQTAPWPNCSSTGIRTTKKTYLLSARVPLQKML